MRKEPTVTKPKTLDDLFDETSTWGDVFYKPPVLWSILVCICGLGTVLIAQSDLGQHQIATNFGKQNVQFAKSHTNSQPYSIELALLQNELDRTKNEMRTTVASRQLLEQKLTNLENKFDDLATGSLNTQNLGDTKPVPPKQMRMTNYKVVEPILADKKSVEVSYKDLPKFDTLAELEPQQQQMPQIATISEPAKPTLNVKKAEITTASIPEPAQKTLPLKLGAISQNVPNAAPIEQKHPVVSMAEKITQNSAPIPSANPNVQSSTKLENEPQKQNANIQNAHEQLADAKKKLAQDLAKELFKNSKTPNEITTNDKDLVLLTGSLEPNKKIDIAQPTRSLFAVKLSTEKSIADVNSKWKTALKNNAAVLAGLEPYIHFEEKTKKPIQMNLTVGPFRNTQEATTVCGQLSAAGTPCSVTPFVGQRLLP